MKPIRTNRDGSTVLTRCTRIGYVLVLLVLFGVAANTSAQPVPPPVLEKGQTAPPKAEGPPREIPESELVQLDKNLPAFKAVRDGPFRLRGQDVLTIEQEKLAGWELDAYNYVLEFARRQPMERLRAYSAKDVQFNNLLLDNVRKEYLRDLIHFKGTLRRIQPLKPTEALDKTDGIEKLYECWIAPDGSANFLVLIVSEVPPGVEMGLSVRYRVAFDAYYFKHYHYESDEKKPEGKGNQWKMAPMFLGRSFEVLPNADEGPVFTGSMLAGVLGGLATIVLIAVGLGWWFRRGDREVKAAATRRIQESVKFEETAGPDSPASSGV